MAKRDPGHLPQTTEGSELLEIRRKPAAWARRLLWASLGLVALALAAAAITFLPHWLRF